ncbi:MAG: hypothetical protein WA118_03650, partial [Carboxydocellales bacterium]
PPVLRATRYSTISTAQGQVPSLGPMNEPGGGGGGLKAISTIISTLMIVYLAVKHQFASTLAAGLIAVLLLMHLTTSITTFGRLYSLLNYVGLDCKPIM